MIRVNLLGNQSHFERFCAAMDKCLACKSPCCRKTCWAAALKSVQEWCDDGIDLNGAVKKWATTGLTHKDGKEILADLLGVDDLDKVRELLREERLPGEAKEKK